MPKEQLTVLLHLPRPVTLDARAAGLGDLLGAAAGNPVEAGHAVPSSRELPHLTRAFQGRGRRRPRVLFNAVRRGTVHG